MEKRKQRAVRVAPRQACQTVLQAVEFIGKVFRMVVAQQPVALHLQIEPVRRVGSGVAAMGTEVTGAEVGQRDRAQWLVIVDQLKQLADKGLLVTLAFRDVDVEARAAPANHLQVGARPDHKTLARQQGSGFVAQGIGKRLANRNRVVGQLHEVHGARAVNAMRRWSVVVAAYTAGCAPVIAARAKRPVNSGVGARRVQPLASRSPNTARHNRSTASRCSVS